jgi:hypothetical protein
MKLNKIYIASFLLLIIALISCNKKYTEDYKNLNQPSDVPPSVLLRSILYDMWDAPFNQDERNDQFTCSNYTYYDDNLYWDGTSTHYPNNQYASLNYTDLLNVLSMEKEASKAANGSTTTAYHALGKFFRAYYFYEMTMKVGDLPMTDALLGTSNLTPKYDAQKQVFIQCLKWLDSANTQIANLITNGVGEFSGDIYYIESAGSSLSPLGAMVEWQKVVNTFRLRVLIQLSNQSSDPDLGLAAQFASVINNSTQYPIMTGMADNLQFAYVNPYNTYPNSPNNFGNDALRYNMAGTYLNAVAGTNDLRAMITSEPARGLGFADTSFSSFVGAPSGQSLSIMAADVQAAKISLIGRHRYWETYTGENTFIVSYPEMCFNIAEAINRGWMTGNAEQWYINGIQASQGFYGIADGVNTVTFQQGLLGQDVSYIVHWTWANFYAQASVKYAGNNTTGLNQILLQKYLAFFRNSGLEAYYQWRRTGVPAFDAGTGTGNSGIIPIRWQYPLSESSTNTTNYNAAVSSQYGGKDDINHKMWLLK